MIEIKDIKFKIINSTNLWAKENLESFNREYIYFITSDQQFNGIGTNNKSWYSPIGGLYTSVCISSKYIKPYSSNITLNIAILISEIFNNLNINMLIKWPNDLMLNEKKIGGILSDYINDWYIIGIGININNDERQIKENIVKNNFPISTIYEETKKLLDIELVLNLFKERLIINQKLNINNIFKFEEYNILKNKKIKILLENEINEGDYNYIDEDANLVLTNFNNKFNNGEIISFT